MPGIAINLPAAEAQVAAGCGHAPRDHGRGVFLRFAHAAPAPGYPAGVARPVAQVAIRVRARKIADLIHIP